MFKSKSSRRALADGGERAPSATKLTPAQRPQDYFETAHRTYSCIHCRAQLANHDELMSKLFQGNHGRAYLFNKVTNVGCKQAVKRELLTGLHAVADIYCDSCETVLGWKYEQAYVPSQKYKEGKYIIELAHILKENDWDLNSCNTRELLADITKQRRAHQGPQSASQRQNHHSTTETTHARHYRKRPSYSQHLMATDGVDEHALKQPLSSLNRSSTITDLKAAHQRAAATAANVANDLTSAANESNARNGDPTTNEAPATSAVAITWKRPSLVEPTSTTSASDWQATANVRHSVTIELGSTCPGTSGSRPSFSDCLPVAISNGNQLTDETSFG